jgi:hypothetical protein
MQKDYTQEWRDYQSGLEYNQRLDYYAKVDLNWRFYNGKQWVGIVTNGLSKWVFNFCRSAINYFIAFMISQKLKMQYSAENIPDEPTNDQEGQIKGLVTLLSDMADMKWEKDKMDSLIKDLLLDGANSGDMCAHVFWDSSIETGQLEKGDFKTEAVDGGNIMFGNPNNKLVEKQPYVLIINRETVSELKKQAKANKVPKEDYEQIASDEENTYQAGEHGKVELENKGETGKALTLIKYWKKDGRVFWNKSTKYCSICKDKDLGISRYPIAWANWESVKNSYHGMSATEQIIDNQISVNHMFAMVSYWMRMSAFGKTIIDQNHITSWSNQLGTVVKADSNGGPISNLVHQLQAGQFNQAILTVIDMAIKYTKEFIGANDALTGQVDPEQASGVAIISTAKQASMPLINVTMNRDQLVEDLGLIWGEFFLKKYVNRKVGIRQNEKMVTAQYNTESIEAVKDILLQCKVDVGPSNYYSEIVGIQALDKLLAEGHITKLQYFERVAKMNLIPDCQGLIEDAQAEMQMIQQQEQQQAQMQEQGQLEQQAGEEAQMNQEDQAREARYEQMKQWLDQQPPELQQKIMALPSEQKEETIMKLMQEDVKNSMKQQEGMI